MKSNTFPGKTQSYVVAKKKEKGTKELELIRRHISAMDEVIRKVKSYSDERRKALADITDKTLRASAKK